MIDKNRKMKFFILVLCFYFLDYAWGIQCHSGAVFQSPLLSLDNFTAIECPPDSQYCLRGSGLVETAFEFNGEYFVSIIRIH